VPRRARVDIARWAAVGTIVLVLLVLVDVQRHGGGNPVSLVQPGRSGPSARAFAEDFPDLELPEGLGLDGQMYYAIARQPFDLDEVAIDLDRPRYRLQRPLLSWGGWALHPGGGGVGLVLALFLVGVVGIAVGAAATGLVSRQLGGPGWTAAAFALVPGAYWSLRVTVSDALAFGLALAAVALAQRDRHGPAVAAAILAVLAKEPAILVLVGWAAHRRDRPATVMLAAAAGTVVGWMAWLGGRLPADPSTTDDLTVPFRGLYLAWRDIWSQGDELVGMACMGGGLAIGVVALVRRGPAHPLWWAVAVQIGFLLCLGPNPTGVNFGSTRMTMPVMVLALVCLTAPADPTATPGPELTGPVGAPAAAP
jgi:hypothetical protein